MTLQRSKRGAPSDRRVDSTYITTGRPLRPQNIPTDKNMEVFTADENRLVIPIPFSMSNKGLLRMEVEELGGIETFADRHSQAIVDCILSFISKKYEYKDQSYSLPALALTFDIRSWIENSVLMTIEGYVVGGAVNPRLKLIKISYEGILKFFAMFGCTPAFTHVHANKAATGFEYLEGV